MTWKSFGRTWLWPITKASVQAEENHEKLQSGFSNGAPANTNLVTTIPT
jgi:hypothetical protein